MQARRGELVDVLEGPGLLATVPGVGAVGVVTWLVDPDGASAEMRPLAVAASHRRRGLARALMDAAHAPLRGAGVRRAWLVTTNDNRAALALYEGLGYRLVEVRRGAVDVMRRTLKPSIPLVDEHGVPISDELELETSLAPETSREPG